MRFVDEIVIRIRAGNGGKGSSHFRREKYVPFGGPDGGNGGQGGSIYILGDRNKRTLFDFQQKTSWFATHGEGGGGRLKDGKCGEDITINVPLGTEVYTINTNEESISNVLEEIDNKPTIKNLYVEILEHDQKVLIAKGGRGGKGNNFFKSATNQAPSYCQPGEYGEQVYVQLILKLIADVGLVGFPNAGKSTLISRISSAKPKIADYPFTTLEPNLGVVSVGDGQSYVVADIPGLIPDAHLGKGLGRDFLRHIERTKVIAHLIDINNSYSEQIQNEIEIIKNSDAFQQKYKDFHLEDNQVIDALASYEGINNELYDFSSDLIQKKTLVLLTKSEIVEESSKLSELVKIFKSFEVEAIPISSVTGEGIEMLKYKLFSLINISPINYAE